MDFNHGMHFQSFIPHFSRRCITVTKYRPFTSAHGPIKQESNNFRDEKKSNLWAKDFRPNVGKLENPQSSPAAKNHWKNAHTKLKEKDLNSTETCFL